MRSLCTKKHLTLIHLIVILTAILIFGSIAIPSYADGVSGETGSATDASNNTDPVAPIRWNGFYIDVLPSCTEGLGSTTLSGEKKVIPAIEAHVPVTTGTGIICAKCGEKLNYFEHVYTDPKTKKKSVVKFYSPEKTNKTTSVALTVQNASGIMLDYKVYYQKTNKLYYKYPEYKKYIDMHGCSTCALTTVLNASVPKYRDYTPDMVLKKVIKPALGSKVFNKNFKKKLSKQMPIGLKGISRVLTKNGVRNKYVYKYTKKSAAKQIKAHLKSGNPVIFYQSSGLLTPKTHAMVMLGLDDKGNVIVGDSILRPASKWGKYDRLVKFHTTTNLKSNSVENICKYFKYSTKSVKKVTDFYNGRKGNVAYVLVYND